MIQDLYKFYNVMVSNTALEQAYETRRRIVLNKNNRSALTVLLVGGILLGLLAFVAGMIFVEKDTQGYLKSRNRVEILDRVITDWKLAQIDACKGKETDCLPFEFTSVGALRPVSRQDVLNLETDGENARYIHLQFTIPFSAWGGLSDYLTLAFSAPNMTYNKAKIYLNGKLQRNYFLSRPIHFPFQTKSFKGSPLTIDLMIESIPSEPFKLGVSRPAFISTQRELEKFHENELMKSSGRGDWIALVSRLTLALFAIALFLMIDSSSESLGLALFMGLEALGIAAKQNWLPLSALGPWWDLFASGLFTNLGLMFRLYFFVNIARLAEGSFNRWLTGGLIWAIPMAFYSMISGNKPDSAYPVMVTVASLVVAFLGIAICVRSYTFIIKMDLRWRRMALLSAAIANVPSVLISINALSPSSMMNSGWSDTLNNLHFNSGFILALSAFFNISSLENRVRALTAVQTKAKQLELELELGRSVQKQQLRLPTMPDEIKVDYFQTAASYVSGDTFFCHWDSNRDIFTALLNDVTGHGVQAALKATICNVMADIIWGRGQFQSHQSSDESVIAKYDQMIRDYLKDRFQMSDIHSVCGFDFFPLKGQINIYRSNAPFPIVLQTPDPRETNKASKVVNLAIRNAETKILKLNPGAVVILMSDGINFSSREHANIIRKLETYVQQRSNADLAVEDIKNLIVELARENASHVDDDKTVFIFKWQPAASQRPLIRPA